MDPKFKTKLKEMFLVLRPTERGTGRIPTKEIEYLLRTLGFNFLITPTHLELIRTAID